MGWPNRALLGSQSALIFAALAVSAPVTLGCYSDPDPTNFQCWKEGQPAECPISLVSFGWNKPPPNTIVAGTPITMTYELQYVALDNTQVVAQDGKYVTYANVQACPKDVGYCTPFAEAVVKGDPQSGTNFEYTTTVTFPKEGDFTLIAHDTFYVAEGNGGGPSVRWDVIMSSTRSVLPAGSTKQVDPCPNNDLPTCPATCAPAGKCTTTATENMQTCVCNSGGPTDTCTVLNLPAGAAPAGTAAAAGTEAAAATATGANEPPSSMETSPAMPTMAPAGEIPIEIPTELPSTLPDGSSTTPVAEIPSENAMTTPATASGTASTAPAGEIPTEMPPVFPPEPTAGSESATTPAPPTETMGVDISSSEAMPSTSAQGEVSRTPAATENQGGTTMMSAETSPAMSTLPSSPDTPTDPMIPPTSTAAGPETSPTEIPSMAGTESAAPTSMETAPATPTPTNSVETSSETPTTSVAPTVEPSTTVESASPATTMADITTTTTTTTTTKATTTTTTTKTTTTSSAKPEEQKETPGKVDFTVDGNIETFDTQLFIKDLAESLGVPPETIKILGIESGSVIVKTELDPAAFNALQNTTEGTLENIGISGVNVREEPVPVGSSQAPATTQSPQTSASTTRAPSTKPIKPTTSRDREPLGTTGEATPTTTVETKADTTTKTSTSKPTSKPTKPTADMTDEPLMPEPTASITFDSVVSSERMRFTVEGNVDSFDKDKFQQDLADTLGVPKSDIAIYGVFEGSVVVLAELSPYAKVALADVDEAALKKIGVISYGKEDEEGSVSMADRPSGGVKPKPTPSRKMTKNPTPSMRKHKPTKTPRPKKNEGENEDEDEATTTKKKKTTTKKRTSTQLKKPTPTKTTKKPLKNNGDDDANPQARIFNLDLSSSGPIPTAAPINAQTPTSASGSNSAHTGAPTAVDQSSSSNVTTIVAIIVTILGTCITLSCCWIVLLIRYRRRKRLNQKVSDFYRPNQNGGFGASGYYSGSSGSSASRLTPMGASGIISVGTLEHAKIHMDDHSSITNSDMNLLKPSRKPSKGRSYPSDSQSDALLGQSTNHTLVQIRPESCESNHLLAAGESTSEIVPISTRNGHAGGVPIGSPHLNRSLHGSRDTWIPEASVQDEAEAAERMKLASGSIDSLCNHSGISQSSSSFVVQTANQNEPIVVLSNQVSPPNVKRQIRPSATQPATTVAAKGNAPAKIGKTSSSGANEKEARTTPSRIRKPNVFLGRQRSREGQKVGNESSVTIVKCDSLGSAQEAVGSTNKV